MLDAAVLVLNRSFLPIHVTSVRRAFILLYQGLAKAVDERYDTFEFEAWRRQSVRSDDHSIGTVAGRIRVPRVIQLALFDRVPRRHVRFSRTNIYARDRNTCQYCGRRKTRAELNLDHVIPRSQGGERLGRTWFAAAWSAIGEREVARRARRACDCSERRSARAGRRSSAWSPQDKHTPNGVHFYRSWMRRTGTPSWLSIRRGEPGLPGRDDDVVATPPSVARIWAVGGGKGGIGKSFLVANLATVAARSGKRVILIDADLGGANLHTCLGVRAGERISLSDYFEERVVDLDKVAIETPIPGLRLILGALGHTGKAETTQEQRSALLKAVRRLPADLVIFDLAAGTDRSTIDFFLEADDGFVVTTPEPTAIENAYAFLRAAFYRRLAAALSDSNVRELIRVAMDQRNERGIRTPGDLLAAIERIDRAEGDRFRRVLETFRPHLVVNQVRDTEEVKMGFSITSVCKKYFGIDIDYAGYICFDDNVWRSVKDRRPLVLAYPRSDGALYVRRIVKKLLGT